ncbi:unnamed protein product [Caenorhabditis auriculariae]|uniref:t-SNARE coiled-coil homology domain-containing protein n=1 Tax=Caenorhabditis auriculariae TaxID=2777116 RepID=A0A8S1GS14_9PELO|nr:unnamed protein product [Caenorhabditis auriculariae]
MFRDRFAEFQERAGIEASSSSRVIRRYQIEENGEVQAPLIDEAADFENFLERVGNIRKELSILTDDFNKMTQLHLVLLSTPGADSEQVQILNACVDRFVQRSKLLKDSVKIMDDEVKNNPGTCGIPRAKKEQVYAIEKSLVTLLGKFNAEQIDYKEKAVKKITEYLRIKDIEVPDDEIAEAVSSGNISDLTKGVILGYNEKKALYQDVKSRADELKQLEASIRELADMFHDLHLLVVSQGEMLDRVETSVANATDYAERAKGNVQEARKLQKRARKMKVIMLIGAIVAIILLLIFLQGLVCHFTPIC